jgi:O-antigen/teichoic acid export membrane protein
MIKKLQTIIAQKITKDSFGHHVLVMFAGTALGQCFAVILSPALTRLYTPETFGILGAFVSILGILSVISALRYEMALPITRTQDDAINLLAVCGLAVVTTTVISTIALMVIPNNWLGDLAPYKMLMPIGFLCIGTYHVMIYYATQQSAFQVISKTKISQGVAGPVTQAGLGLFSGSAWGLLAGFIVGQSTGILQLFSELILKSPEILKMISWKKMRALAKRYIRFPLISSWSGVINAAGTSHLLLIIVPMMYSTTIAGFIFLTDRIIGRPLLLISTSILQVYVGETSKSLTTNNPAAIRHRFLQLAKCQFLIVSAWLLLLNLLAPPLFPLVFGEEWAATVPYLQVLSIAYLPQMVVHALVHTLQILEKQALSAAWEVGRLIAILGAFVISYFIGFNALEALLLYSICQALSQIVLFILMYKSIQSLQKVS